jgi:GTPase SAR1 family protein
MHSQQLQLYVVFTGNTGAGKTSLLSEYLNENKNEDEAPSKRYESAPIVSTPSIDLKRRTVTRENINITYNLWDLPGKQSQFAHSYQSLFKQRYQQAHVIFYCVSREELAEGWDQASHEERFKKIYEANPNAKVQFIVTKADIKPENSQILELTESEQNELQQLNTGSANTPIITSAIDHDHRDKLREDLDKVFCEIAQQNNPEEKEDDTQVVQVNAEEKEENRPSQRNNNAMLAVTMAFSVAATGSSAYFLMKAIEVASSTSLAAVTAMSSIALPGISALMLLYAAYKAKQSDASLSENLLLALSLLNLLPAGIAVFNCVASSAITSAVSGAALTGFAMASIATGGALAAVCFLAVCGMLYKHLNANKSAGFESGGTSVPTPANLANPSNSG